MARQWRADAAEAIDAIERARTGGGVFVSPVSFWEISRLVALGRLHLDVSAQAWADRFVRQPGLAIADLTVKIAIAAAALPDLGHRDPVDRFLISTARIQDLVLVTRDHQIAAYGARGQVTVLRC